MIKIIIAYIAALLLSIVYCKPLAGEIITTLAFSILNTILYVGIYYVLIKWESSREGEPWISKLAYYLLIPFAIIVALDMIFLIINRDFDNFTIVLPAIVYTYLAFTTNKRSIQK